MLKESLSRSPTSSSMREEDKHAIRMPRQFAPLIRNAWYVIASRKDVDRSLKSITVVDTPLVYYRREDGSPIVFDDRCPHRLFPLSKSYLTGDSIRCGYHGFTFDRDGACTFVPGNPDKPNFGLRRYPSVERGPWLWVWMGEEDQADPGKIPLEEGEFGDDSSFEGYILNPCNYMLVLENLLDLTHLFYLHGPMLADQTYSDEPPHTLAIAGGIGTTKIVEATTVGAVGFWCGEDPARRMRREEQNRAFPPSLIDYNAENTPVDRFDEPFKMTRNRFLHAITPSSLYETHQFFWFDLGAPMTIPREQARDTIVDSFFKQDLEAVSYQMQAIMQDQRGEFVERRMVGDRAAIQVHKLLCRRGDEEALSARAY